MPVVVNRDVGVPDCAEKEFTKALFPALAGKTTRTKVRVPLMVISVVLLWPLHGGRGVLAACAVEVTCGTKPNTIAAKAATHAF